MSPSGADANPGTSPASAWRTLAAVNGRSFVAEDRILLEGGQSFSGGLSFDAGDAGSAASPITVTSYGTGRATIRSTTTDGLFAYNTAGLLVSDLVFVGPGAAASTKFGIGFYADLPGGVKLPYVHIVNVDVAGYRVGISIGSWNGTTGYSDISVTRTEAHGNLQHGMIVFAEARGAHADVTVSHGRFYDNLGDPSASTPTGNGVVLGQVEGGLIERSVAWNNGGAGAPGLGPVAIWAYDSNNVTIQFCEAYGNHAAGTVDGGGFDLDIGMTNSVMQYNYSHDNDGAGFGHYQGAGSFGWSGNVVRYNVSENDGRKNNYGAFTVWSAGDPMSDCDIYGNTIFVAPSPTGTPRAVRFNSPSTNFRFFNNLIVTTGGLPLLEVPAGQTGIVFQGNNYWSTGGPFAISWFGAPYPSLSAWSAATGQEMDGATLVGLNVDPLLASPGSGGTIGNPDNLASLAAYRLLDGSPLRDAGLNLPGRSGIDPGPHDFYETPIPQGSGFDIGAHEVLPCSLPAAVGNSLRLAEVAATGRLSFTWTDIPVATSYVVRQDLAPQGTFTTVAGSAPTGAPGLDLAMPPEALVHFLVAGVTTCGEGPLRQASERRSGRASRARMAQPVTISCGQRHEHGSKPGSTGKE